MKFFVFLGLFLGTFLMAAPMDVGQNIASFSCKDQFGQKVAITSSTKKLIFVFSKEKGEVSKKYFDLNPNYLSSQKVLYFADISSAPSFVTSMFMIPKFQGYKFKIGLIEDEVQAALVPKKEDMITFIELDNLNITKIEYKQTLP